MIFGLLLALLLGGGLPKCIEERQTPEEIIHSVIIIQLELFCQRSVLGSLSHNHSISVELFCQCSVGLPKCIEERQTLGKDHALSHNHSISAELFCQRSLTNYRMLMVWNATSSITCRHYSAYMTPISMLTRTIRRSSLSIHNY